jgi:hypothetical protein
MNSIAGFGFFFAAILIVVAVVDGEPLGSPIAEHGAPRTYHNQE